MFREIVNALAACLVTLVLCSAAYPAAVWGVAWLAFPHQAAGSLIERDGKTIGSELVAQPFASDKYFQPRPSAVDYKADATGGSNLGTKNPDLRKKVAERALALKATAEHPAPVDMVTASGGGLDPDISPSAAEYQAPRVAAARNLPLERVRALIDRHTVTSGAIIGAPPRVNVLRLNLDLDDDSPAPGNAAVAASGPVDESRPKDAPSAAGDRTAPATQADEIAAVRTRVDAVSRQLDEVRERLDALPAPKPTTGLKELEERVSKLAESFTQIRPTADQVERLEARAKGAEESVAALRDELKLAGASLKDLEKQMASRPHDTLRVAAVSMPASDVTAGQALDLGPGLEAFRKGHYSEAAATFRSMTVDHPSDARAWYLAAVANGLATRTWTGVTQDLVTRGVELEWAGSPGTAEIDAILSGLTRTTGRDWLAHYRAQARLPRR